MTTVLVHRDQSVTELSPLELQTLILARAHTEAEGQAELRPATLELYIARALSASEEDSDWTPPVLTGGLRRQLGLALAKLVRSGLLELRNGYVPTSAGIDALHRASVLAGRDDNVLVKEALELVESTV